MNNFATERPMPNWSWGRVCPATMDNPLPEYPKTDIVVPSPARHCIPTNERGGWYLELIDCVVRRMRWHCVYFVVGGGRDAIGIPCRNLPPKRAI